MSSERLLLIVEDDTSFARTLGKSFERRDYEVLHAASLVFPHPEGGERRISAPVPDDMRAVLEGLGLAVPEQRQPDAR